MQLFTYDYGYTKNTAWIIYNPDKEKISFGNFLIIWNETENEGLLVIVTKVKPVDLPGLLLRTVLETAAESMEPKPISPEMEPLLEGLMFAICKILKKVSKDQTGKSSFADPAGWKPPRPCRIEHISGGTLAKLMNIGVGNYPVQIGTQHQSNEPFSISIEDLSDEADLRGINLITGKKWSGKSHLGKKLLTGFIEHKVFRCVAYDRINEYRYLKFNPDVTKSRYYDDIKTLIPGKSLQFTLVELGPSLFAELLNLEEGTSSFRSLVEIWKKLEQKNELTIDSLLNAVKSEYHESVRYALENRLRYLKSTGIISDHSINFEQLINSNNCVVIALRDIRGELKSLVTKATTGNILNMRRPMAIFAEEAQSYMDIEDWLELMGLTRHFGVTAFFITNQPRIFTEKADLIDNLFIFKITDTDHAKILADAVVIDHELIFDVCSQLPKGSCMVVGKATHGIPFVIDVAELEVKTGGKTRSLVFNKS